MSDTAARVSGLLLVMGAVLLSVAIAIESMNPVVRHLISPAAAALLFLSSLALLVSLPVVYARQSAAAGGVGLAGYILLQAGIVLFTAVGSVPLLYPSLDQAPGNSATGFLLGTALVLGLLLTGIAVMRAGIFPRTAGILLLVATAGFFFDFFVAEFLPPIAGQLGSSFFGVVLGLALAWLGVSLWSIRIRQIP